MPVISSITIILTEKGSRTGGEGHMISISSHTRFPSPIKIFTQESNYIVLPLLLLAINYLDGGWTGGEGNESSCRLIADSSRGGVEKVINTSNEPGPLARVSMAHFIDQLNNDQLENIIEFMDLVDACGEVVQSTLLHQGNDTQLPS